MLFLIGLGVSSAFSPTAHATASQCSKCASVWCHTYISGYTQCALYGPHGEYIQEVPPTMVPQYCLEVNRGLLCINLAPIW